MWWRAGVDGGVGSLSRHLSFVLDIVGCAQERDFAVVHFLVDLRLRLAALPRGKASSGARFLEFGGLLRYLVVDLTPSLAASSERTQIYPLPVSPGGRSSFRNAYS